MNEKKRRALRNAIELIAKASSIVEQVQEEESDVMDNYPENLQGTDRYEAMERAVDSLSDASEKLDEAKDLVEAAIF